MRKDFLTTAFLRIRGRMTRTGTADDYSDALQDAFCRLWTRRESIADDREAEALLNTATRNARIDTLRLLNRHPSVGMEEAPPMADTEPTDYDDSEIYDEVDRIIRMSLSERDRSILHLRDRCGWEFEEIATHMGLTESNVRMILSRARKTVREIYKKRKHG